MSCNWQLDHVQARLKCGPLRAKLQLDRLSRGLGEIEWNRKRVGNCPFQLLVGDDGPATRHVETYVRGNDLVATYESDGPLGAPQVYWRAHHDEALSAVGLQIVVSKHTSLLDSHPGSAIDSSLNGSLFHAASLDPSAFTSIESSELIRIGASRSDTHLFVVRNPHEPCAFAQLLHPSDFESIELRDQLHDVKDGAINAWHIKSLIFPERLEKGVIRRARICGWFMPAENDLETAVELAKRFVAEPPPLTT
jgi:hypothetical protein